MEFWDDIRKKINTAADYTAKEAEKLSEIAKLKYKISQAKNKLDLLYMSIGKLRYEETVLGKDTPTDLYDGFNAQVTEIILEIDDLKVRLDEVRNLYVCPACGNKIARDAAYCPKCGAKRNGSVDK